MSAFSADSATSHHVSATSEPPMTVEDQLKAMKEKYLREKRNVRFICHHFSSTIDDFLAVQEKYDKVRRDYANVEIENRLLRSEVDDINQEVDSIQDRMQEQYHESLVLKMRNAELKERNTFLNKEVRRLREIQEQEETKKADTKNEEPKRALSFIDDRTVIVTPAAYQPTRPAPSKHILRYAKTAVSSRAKSSTPPSYIDPRGSEFAATRPQPAPARTSYSVTSRSSSVKASVNEPITDTKTARKISAGQKAAKDAARVTSVKNLVAKTATVGSVSTSNTANYKPNVGQKRTLTPALRETLRRTVARNPDPARVWIDLPVVTDETRKYERKTKKVVIPKKPYVEDAGEEDEEVQAAVKKDKGKAKVESSAFV